MADKIASVQQETYWIRTREKLIGPLPASEIAAMPDVGPYTLLCPGNLDPKHRRSWKLAKTFPTVNALISMPAISPLQRIRRRATEHRRPSLANPANVPPPGATPPPDDPLPPNLQIKTPPHVWRMGAAVLGVLGVVLYLGWRSPPKRVKDRPKNAAGAPAHSWDPVLDFYLPACKVTVRERTLGVEPIRQKLPSGEVIMEWPGAAGKESLSFRYDPEEKNLTPMNASSKAMISLRKKCP